ncbi:poly-beta-1,6-N-acetyl-D-glucosamine N-deacetylase PgaB [Acinetobacter sp. S40]|uniref:poly-beta-1,6-N-acetyl-D-glucosamine N-deacetylase PgaB n=1 Tax=Acinetobacter sp. S40 TaxID=2767434 RepID=UPI00190B37BA|nr:poly-beta-1,6-N-acetyl-D-glucosamine N-deacetylase PgaB [Acinetobacter sp. S40]MBJ9985653.1 poly-beta-1,6-N-acetyl-D-glucosamine N-deacetylase PgaB [Acinetobacter sp. S40]
MYKKLKSMMIFSIFLSLSTAMYAQDIKEDAQVHTQGQFVTLTFHDVRDDVANRGDRDSYAISTKNLAQFLSWLKQSDWTVIRLEDIWQARQNNTSLPDKAVLLTFDDGALSSYSRVYPLLKQYQMPAVFAIVTSWINGNSQDAYEAYGQDNLMNWQQMREMQHSDLVEFVSHSDNLHKGVLANPQQNMEPAAITRQFLPASKVYENDTSYHQRIFDDLKISKSVLDRQLGIDTKAIFWPYGAVTKETEQLAKQAGLPLSFSLGNVSEQANVVQTYQRAIVMGNPVPEELHAQMLDFLKDIKQPSKTRKSIISMDPSELVNLDGALINEKLGQLLDQLSNLKTNAIILKVVTDKDQDGKIENAFFPTTVLPHHSDVLNRIIWQARTRIGQQVYAELPLDLELKQHIPLVRLTEDLFKNNSSLDGVVLNAQNQMDCALQNQQWDQKCQQNIQQIFKIKEQIKNKAYDRVNISTNFRTVLKVKPEVSQFNGLKPLLEQSLMYSDLVYVEIDPLSSPGTFRAFEKSSKQLSNVQKQQLMVGFNISAKQVKDWKIYTQAYQQLKILGIQKLGVANYELDQGREIHNHLYADLSLNDSALNYKDPYVIDFKAEQK